MKKFPGDKGKTILINKGGVSKTGDIFDLLGDLDELNSYLGLAKINVKDKKIFKWLEEIQEDIFVFSGYLAGMDKPNVEEMIKNLDLKYEYCLENISSIRKFVFSGVSLKSAYLDVSRAICRRAERSAWKSKKNSSAKEVAVWLNHLSKLLFFLARLVDKDSSKKLKFFG